MSEPTTTPGLLTNGELAEIVRFAAYTILLDQAHDLPTGEARRTYPWLFVAIAYSIRHFGNASIVLRLEEIAEFSQLIAQREGGRGWTGAESVRQNFYKMELPIRVTRTFKTVIFDIELRSRRPSMPDSMTLTATVILNDEVVTPVSNVDGLVFRGEDLHNIDRHLRRNFDDLSVIHSGRIAIAAVLTHETVPVIAWHPYQFGKAAETLTIQWGDGSTVAHKKGRPIVYIFRKAGLFHPRIVRRGAEPEPFPFRVEVLRRETLRERLYAALRSALKLDEKQQRERRLKMSVKGSASTRRRRSRPE